MYSLLQAEQTEVLHAEEMRSAAADYIASPAMCRVSCRFANRDSDKTPVSSLLFS